MKQNLVLLSMLLSFTVIVAQVPPASVSLQGYLADSTVNPSVAANGTYSMTFGLWDQLSGGSLIQQETVPAVTAVNGLYEVSLPFGPEVFDTACWLQIEVDGETLLPRLPFESSPYAYLSKRVGADGVDTDAIQDGAVNLDKLAPDCNEGEVIVRTATGWGCLGFTGCLPNNTQACYSGPEGTRGVGECSDGIATCQSDGTWGPCVGDALPVPEACNGQDDDCNGTLDQPAPPGSTIYHHDFDGDGYGDPDDSLPLCEITGQYNTFNTEDCNDHNGNAHPGQTNFYNVPHGYPAGGIAWTYDYNCDGVEEQEFPTMYSCTSNCETFELGWRDFVPACGDTSVYVRGCFPGNFPNYVCNWDNLNNRTQVCR